MPVFIRLRVAALRLAYRLRQSILRESHLWDVDTDGEGNPCLTAGPFRVVAVPRAVQFFDALHVYCGTAEIWLPLWSRLRLRNAVRTILAEYGLEMFESAKLESEASSRSSRRTSRAKQTA